MTRGSGNKTVVLMLSFRILHLEFSRMPEWGMGDGVAHVSKFDITVSDLLLWEKKYILDILMFLPRQNPDCW